MSRAAIIGTAGGGWLLGDLLVVSFMAPGPPTGLGVLVVTVAATWWAARKFRSAPKEPGPSRRS